MNPKPHPAVLIRAYAPEDAVATLRIFERAVSISALSRYTQGQVTAWLGRPRDPRAWAADRARVSTFVAELDGRIAGFSDLSEEGYVDRLFVDPDHGRRGVGTALLQHVSREAMRRGIAALTTHASLVARPVFEADGFAVTHQETVQKDGEDLKRFFMTKFLVAAGTDTASQGVSPPDGGAAGARS
jgi:putative acetyltransferase